MKQKQGQWKPYNVKALVRNVKQVLKLGRIARLNKPTYEFIINHMGFIAHYNLLGFRDEYQDLRRFCQKLQTSEYSADYDYNLKQADRYEKDPDFRKWYGVAYNTSKAEAIRGIVATVRKFESTIANRFALKEQERDLAEASRLLTMYGYRLPKLDGADRV
jgi:hypothetical protein